MTSKYNATLIKEKNMKKILLVLFILIRLNTIAQVQFEKGYFIDNSNSKVECLIKNKGWNNSPKIFEYKLSESSEAKILSVKDVKEFGISNTSKYSSFMVSIDKSSDDRNNLSSNRKPVFEEEQLFLKTIIEGKANLYIYKESNLVRFFFTIDDSHPKQLVFKKFIDNNKIIQNLQFKQQLWEEFKCKGLTISDLENISYNKNHLSKFFHLYNKCQHSTSIDYEKKAKKRSLNLYIRPGINFNSLSIEYNISNSRNTDYGSNIGFRLGFETELILPFHKDKWALTLEPTFQYSRIVDNSLPLTSNLNHKFLEINFGLRHYFFLNNENKIFINGGGLYDVDLGSNIDFNFGRDLSIKGLASASFGIGYIFRKKYGIEVRYITTRSILLEDTNWKSKYQYLSFIFGYKIL